MPRLSLARLRPRKIPFRHWAQRAAVAVVYRKGRHGPELLFMERAKRAGDPWSGHISFPGGIRQANDPSACATAIREAQEEMGLDLVQHAVYCGRLSDVVTRRHSALKPLVVTPYLFELTQHTPLTLNAEAVHSLWVPASYLRDPSHRQSLRWPVGPLTLKMPCVYYEERCIWGLTLLMLGEILKRPELQ